jgi:lipopolysaccharide/colanic/teichoic acid biosynthesis glycosyltransferase
MLAAMPLLISIGLLVLLCDGMPVFFRHARVGEHGTTFGMLKFRTMRSPSATGELQITPGDDRRISRLGRWLRRYRLDELPQLINVSRGEMNLVGPRPEYPLHAAAYGRQAAAMLVLTPGITDPGTLFFLYRETELITGAQDPTDVYLRCVMPLRNRMSIEYSRNATTRDDLLVLAATLFAIASPSMARPLALAIVRRLRQRGAHQPSIRLNNDYLVGASALTGVNSRS